MAGHLPPDTPRSADSSADWADFPLTTSNPPGSPAGGPGTNGGGVEGSAFIPDEHVVAPQGTSAAQRTTKSARRWLDSVFNRFSLPEEDAAHDPLERLVGATPPWFVSMAVHLGLMIMLGLIVLKVHHEIQPSDTVEIDLSEPEDKPEIYAETLGEQLENPDALMSSNGPDDGSQKLAISDLPPVEDPLAGLPSLNLPKSPTGTLPAGTDEIMPAIGLALTGREAGMKSALVKAYGGTALTEESVNMGLKWLASRQTHSGLWSMTGPYTEGARSENEAAATGLALLAFQGAGYTPKGDPKDPFTRVVRRGWDALGKKMDDDGKFFQDANGNQALYTQAICTIALCELFGMTGDYEYRDAAQKAINYCMKIQAPEGGWRYQPGIDSDMSVTGWFSMALQSARMAGLEVQSPVFDRLEEFLDSVARDGGSQYAYRVRDGATLSLTAEGLLCRQYLGWKHDDARLRTGVDYLIANLPEWDRQNVYYWYYGTQVCHHMEGDAWRKWNGVMRQMLPDHQVKKGKERGSWDPLDDRWGPDGGRLYVTCLSIYILEVYYRHLPLYQTGLVAK